MREHYSKYLQFYALFYPGHDNCHCLLYTSFQGNIVCLYHNARLSGNRIGAGVNDNFAGIGTICTFNGQALCLNPQLLVCSSCIGAFSECNGCLLYTSTP